jgi:hypothetical protein
MASGNTLCVFFPAASEPVSASYATLDVRNNVIVADFIDAHDESLEFAGYMPRHYGDGGVTATIGWMATDTTVGPHDVVWNLSFKSVSDDADDLDSKSFAAVNYKVATEASASGEVAYDTIGFTDGADMDSVDAGEYFRLKITRDGNHTSDGLADDAELVFIELQET